MAKDNRSFFEKLTGAIRIDQDEEFEEETPVQTSNRTSGSSRSATQSTRANIQTNDWVEEPEEGELTVDVYQNSSEITIKTMVAGVKPEDLDITITRDTVIIKGKRESEKIVADDDYVYQELYWGSFSRTINLPAEVEVEEAEAVEKHGLLIIKLPKIDKNRQARLKVKG